MKNRRFLARSADMAFVYAVVAYAFPSLSYYLWVIVYPVSLLVYDFILLFFFRKTIGMFLLKLELFCLKETWRIIDIAARCAWYLASFFFVFWPIDTFEIRSETSDGTDLYLWDVKSGTFVAEKE